jgi:hypothetical protein
LKSIHSKDPFKSKFEPDKLSTAKSFSGMILDI